MLAIGAVAVGAAASGGQPGAAVTASARTSALPAPTRAYGFPYAVVGARQRRLPVHYTAYGDESDPGPFPVPPGAPVEGGQLRLKASYGLGRFSGGARVIAVALKRYGLIVADNGSNWYLGGTSDRRWDDENLDQLKRIPGSAFEVVKSAAGVHAC